jgi:hypothetical protein
MTSRPPAAPRFWKGGFWKNHLRGKPYHISALYVIDLQRFRRIAAGDNYRWGEDGGRRGRGAAWHGPRTEGEKALWGHRPWAATVRQLKQQSCSHMIPPPIAADPRLRPPPPAPAPASLLQDYLREPVQGPQLPGQFGPGPAQLRAAPDPHPQPPAGVAVVRVLVRQRNQAQGARHAAARGSARAAGRGLKERIAAAAISVQWLMRLVAAGGATRQDPIKSPRPTQAA